MCVKYEDRSMCQWWSFLWAFFLFLVFEEDFEIFILRWTFRKILTCDIADDFCQLINNKEKNSIQFGIIRNLNGMTWISERRRNMGHFPFTIKSTWSAKKKALSDLSFNISPNIFSHASNRSRWKLYAQDNTIDGFYAFFCVAVRSGKENKVNVKRCITTSRYSKLFMMHLIYVWLACALSRFMDSAGSVDMLWHLRQDTPRQLRSGEDVTKAPNLIDICVHVYNYVSPSCSLLFAMLSAGR